MATVPVRDRQQVRIDVVERVEVDRQEVAPELGEVARDGDARDDVVRAELKAIPVKDLRPTQGQLWLDNMVPQLVKFGPPGRGAPAIASREGFILDGHHRYGQNFLVDQTRKFEAMFIPLDIETLLRVGKSFGAAMGNKGKA